MLTSKGVFCFSALILTAQLNPKGFLPAQIPKSAAPAHGKCSTPGCSQPPGAQEAWLTCNSTSPPIMRGGVEAPDLLRLHLWAPGSHPMPSPSVSLLGIQLLCWVKDQHHVDAGGFPGFHLLWRTGAADISVFMTQARLIPPVTRSLPSPLSQLLAHVFLMNCREKIALENLEAYLDGFSGYEISTTLPSASFPLRHLPPSSPCCLHSGHTGLLLLLKHPRLGLPDKIQVSQ